MMSLWMMMQYHHNVKQSLVCLLLAAIMFAHPMYAVQADSADKTVDAIDALLVPSRYFPAYGHNVGGAFLAFFDAHGGEEICGNPITEVLDEYGQHVQYFEHMRLEIDPRTPERVDISRIGQQIARERAAETPFTHHEPAATAISSYFPTTGHNVSHQFRDAWQHYGGYALLGYPVSEAFIEHHTEDNTAYTVQYFERVRLEYYLAHPGAPPTIRIGNMGSDYAHMQQLAATTFAPARPLAILGETTIHFTPLPGDIQNISLAVRQFDKLRVMPNEHVSYLETVGELTAATGYVPGSGIVNGGAGQVIAGGICLLSSALFQAVFAAGIAIEERHPHSVLLPEFREKPGLDSAVFTSDGHGNTRTLYDLDLRWHNDLPNPIIITTDVITQGVLHAAVWGYHDGRTVIVGAPVTAAAAPPGSLWYHSNDLARCDVQQIAIGSSGMSITVDRIVKDAAGTILHNDRFYSSYSPYKDVFLYGDGVVPVQDGSPNPATIARHICQSQ